MGPPPTVWQTSPSVVHCSGADLFQCRVVEPQMTVFRLLLQAHWTQTHPLTQMQTNLIYAQRQPQSSQKKAKNTCSPPSAWDQPVSSLTMTQGTRAPFHSARPTVALVIHSAVSLFPLETPSALAYFWYTEPSHSTTICLNLSASLL
uniref:Uncharacterized protein n=1 Tax=Pipistrellus kuhlii TaxID=59472 RepID=A0A7J7W3S6_PIPKU|nr:hypothetical protein mPipKuh1_008147 [Pipistrellus kuhlii]